MLMGFDPEIFVLDHENKLQLPNLFTRGTKGHPSYNTEDTIGTLCDGVAIELNTKTPAFSRRAFSGMVVEAMDTARRVCVPGRISTASVVELHGEVRRTEQAMELGCEPDYCVYERRMMRPMTARRLGNKRYAGGHLHISEMNDIDPHRWAKLLDIYLGSWLCFDDGAERRKYIGAGRIRIKGSNYIEYRTPSNAWLFHPDWAPHIHRSAELATGLASNPEAMSDAVIEEAQDLVLATINKGDKEAQMALFKKFDILDPRVAA